MVSEPTCPITGEEMQPAFRATVLQRYEVQYFRCPACGLIQTEKPHWLSEAYSSALSSLDVGLVSRNLSCAGDVSVFLSVLNKSDARIVDIGGGCGLFARLMRDRGFDCYSTDPYCQNILARGFEPVEGMNADVLTAFEVFEHITDPLVEIRSAIEKFGASTIIFSTLTYAEPVPDSSWWYWSLPTGQHVTVYSKASLRALGAQLGLHFYSINSGLHLFRRERISPTKLRLIRSARLRRGLSLLVEFSRRRKSLVASDHARMLAGSIR